MSSSSSSSSPTASGITIDEKTGERLIPSSTRADGSKRREIRIRPGYKPPEDVELYKNRGAAAWRNRGKGGIPGAEPVNDDTSTQTPKNKTPKKKNKPAENTLAPERLAQGPSNEKEKSALDKENWRTGAGKKSLQEHSETGKGDVGEEGSLDPEAERKKKARGLKKKLKQARELSQKKEAGESLLPEQLDKIIRINELVRQLDSLGFDEDGEQSHDIEEAKTETRSGE
ncbi:hypothetical protein FQN57_000558 [Myotisia sp. PD_48]|nr:hypothetical protein FQN57_000558 [Myotisia sp. PD_48]